MVLRRNTRPDTRMGSTNINSEEVKGRVAKRAYELFEKRGYTHGNDLEDWLRAEREVRREFSR